MHDIEHSGKVVQIQFRQAYILAADIQSGQSAATFRHT